MALILRHWRTWLALAVLGSAGAFGYRGDWAWCAGAASLVLLRAVCWVVCELLAAWDEALQEAGGRGEGAGAVGRHRKRPVQEYTCSRCGAPGVTEWDSEEAAAMGRARGLDLVCDACLIAKLRLVASLNGAGD